MFAAASEDGTVQLWSFGNGRLLRQLPRPVAAVVNRPKKPGAGAADLPEAGGPPGHWQLAWSATGNRLLAVQSAPGTSSFVNLWALEGDQLCATYSLQTGRETTSLEAKPKDNILHHLGKLKHCTYIV
eukprot:symbB.v1.2.016544.t1/scaffold1260.1/size128208/5